MPASSIDLSILFNKRSAIWQAIWHFSSVVKLVLFWADLAGSHWWFGSFDSTWSGGLLTLWHFSLFGGHV